MSDDGLASKTPICIIFASDSCDEIVGEFVADLECYHNDTVFEGDFRTNRSKTERAVMKLFPPDDIFSYESEIEALKILKDATRTPNLLAAGCTPGSTGKVPGGTVVIKTACPGKRQPWDIFWNQFSDFNSTHKVWTALKETLQELRAYRIQLEQILPQSVLWDEDSQRVYIMDFDDWKWVKDAEGEIYRSMTYQLYGLTRNSQLLRDFNKNVAKATDA
ncbi:hypothetical protein TWF730_009110 [Orbilia blumenaviensis]|uniref:Uncharacterized protein n=1 Tax=Orbilia blumenaviensis TaxID=1796055 RepID=A0AAV9V0G1_9PEZI